MYDYMRTEKKFPLDIKRHFNQAVFNYESVLKEQDHFHFNKFLEFKYSIKNIRIYTTVN